MQGSIRLFALYRGVTNSWSQIWSRLGYDEEKVLLCNFYRTEQTWTCDNALFMYIWNTRVQFCYVTTTHPSPTPAIPWFCPRATRTQIQVTWIWDPVMKGCLTINCFFNDRHHVTFALVLYAVVQCKQGKKKETKSINSREGIQLKLTFVRRYIILK